MLNRTDPFCDFLSFTTPSDRKPLVLESLDDFLTGFQVERDSDFSFRSASRGSFSWGDRNMVTWFSATGGFLTDLRLCGMLNNFLASISNHPEDGYIPHKVTRLDLTVDEQVYPPDVLDKAYKLGIAGGVYLTRKAVKSTAVRKIMSPVVYDESGRDTGSVYFGHRKTSKVRMTIYDKTQERALRGIKIAPTARYEIGVTGDMGISLRDASLPMACFYNFCPSNLLSRPDVSPWVSSGEGYSIQRVARLPAVTLKDKMQRSSDLKAILKAVGPVGDHGFDYFVSVARKMYEGECWNDRGL